MSATPETVSVVVELDNVRLGEAARAEVMLRRLTADLDDLRRRGSYDAEVLVAFDPHEVAPADAHVLVAGAGGLPRTRLVPVRDAGYYELKNAAAAEARGDVIVFVDSDVVPEPGWLGKLLEPFASPHVQVVGGNAYVQPRGLWGKTFALAWFFPLRAEEPSLYRSETFFANNVAFRADVFHRFPFPSAGASTRGACTLLASTLHAHEIPIHRTTAAQVGHPPPNGVRRALERALAQGRDRVELARLSHRGERVLEVTVLRDVVRSFAADRRRVDLSLAELPAAAALAAVYYGAVLVGAAAALIAPAAMRRRIRL